MKKYIIIKNGIGSDQELCEIIADSERRALQIFKKSNLSSGQYWIEKIMDKWSLLSSFGGCWTANKIY